MGPTRSETSVRNYHYSLRNSPEEFPTMDWIVRLDTQRFGYFGVWRPVICQKFSGVSEKFSPSIFREYAIQENYSEWTQTRIAESSFKEKKSNF